MARELTFARLLVSFQRRPESAKKYSGAQVLIYSGEHGAWWRPGCAGYTSFIDKAGVYSFDEALRNTSHCGPEKRVRFDFVLEGIPAFREEEWTEEDGFVLWWRFPIEEPPYVGSPLCDSFPKGFVTHWTPLPELPRKPRRSERRR